MPARRPPLARLQGKIQLLVRSYRGEVGMKKYIGLLIVFALSSVMISAECKPGYQSAKVVKVLHVSPGVAAPARADEDSPQRPATPGARSVIFGVPGQPYELRLPPGSNSPEVAAGNEVCFRKEGKMIRVLTGDGKPLPGAAHPIHQMPQTQ
jgi:hypothetical protein